MIKPKTYSCNLITSAMCHRTEADRIAEEREQLARMKKLEMEQKLAMIRQKLQ